MSLNSIFNKLTLEEIKELSESIQKNESNYFGNSLKSSKNRNFVANIFGIKNWMTLIALKDFNPIDKKKKEYCCPNCQSPNFYLKQDGFAHYKIDDLGNTAYSHFATLDDCFYTCIDCEGEFDYIAVSYEFVLNGYNSEDDKTDHLVLWVTVLKDSYDETSLLKFSQNNKNIKYINSIPVVEEKNDGLDLFYNSDDKNKLELLIKERMENR